MKKLFMWLTLFSATILSGFTVDQSLTITGTVRDAGTLRPLPGVQIRVKNTTVGSTTDAAGKYSITVPEKNDTLIFSFIGYEQATVKHKGRKVIDVKLKPSATVLNEVVVVGYGTQEKKSLTGAVAGITATNKTMMIRGMASTASGTSVMAFRPPLLPGDFNTESYTAVNENKFRSPLNDPLSTFGIDVDAASYSNIRRFVNQGQLPPQDAVRIEEMINYFEYDYKQPAGNEPFSVTTELSSAPWNSRHQLLRIGLQGRKADTQSLPASNLVFLVDVSGSMNSYNKLPLVKASLKMLTDQLRASDRVAIVTYAGAASEALSPISGDKKQTIKNAIEGLQAGGYTAGGAGIKMAYELAEKNFIKGGNNRIILATDGDFNIGASSDADMQRLIEEKRKSGVFLSVLGYGMGNYKDSKMETLADKGNGNYAYIDNISEARRVLVREFGGTLFTIAKDVKLQLEFNPEKVQAYRLIGYENRLLNKEDFNDDRKDAGDLGAGHRVTALYEIIPAGITDEFSGSTDDLKYQKTPRPSAAAGTDELLTIKLRYKKPDEEQSKLISHIVTDRSIPPAKTSEDFRFAAAVAGYGLLLRKSEFAQQATFENVAELAQNALGKDPEGYRAEFLRLVKASALLTKDMEVSQVKKE